MKYLSWIISIIFAATAIYLISMNVEHSLDLCLVSPQTAHILNIMPVFSRVNTSATFAILAVSGAMSAIFAMLPALFKSKEKAGAMERKLEKTAISSNESSARVKVLENKIHVLEKALDDAVKKQQ